MIDMEKRIIDEYNIKGEKIQETETRVKSILVNDKNEVLLGYAKNVYQFIGGHVEEKESLIETIKREIEEETGIKLNVNEKQRPVYYYAKYMKNEENQNKKMEIYYYIMKCNKKINYNNTNYTLEEKENNFELRYIPIPKLKQEIIENCEKYENARRVGAEMLEVIDAIEIRA